MTGCPRCDYGDGYARCTCHDDLAGAPLSAVESEALTEARELAHAHTWNDQVDAFYRGEGPAPSGEGHG